MPNWDRVSGGGDGDKGHVPKVPASEPREPVTRPQARNRSSYESSTAEQANRNAAEGVNGQGDLRHIKDRPPEERRARGREGITAGDGGTDKNAETDRRYQALFAHQGEIINTQSERITALKEDNADLEKRNERLENRNDKLGARVDNLQARNDRQAEQLERKDAEIERLKSELAKKTAPASEGFGDEQRTADRQTEGKTVPEKTWLQKVAGKLPGKEELAFGGAGATLVEVIAVNSHHLSDPTKAAIVAATGFGAAGYGLAKKAIDKRVNSDKDGKNAD